MGNHRTELSTFPCAAGRILMRFGHSLINGVDAVHVVVCVVEQGSVYSGGGMRALGFELLLQSKVTPNCHTHAPTLNGNANSANINIVCIRILGRKHTRCSAGRPAGLIFLVPPGWRSGPQPQLGCSIRQ